MKWVCRRCLTALSSEDILNQHIDRCQNQQPTNITFSWKDDLKFEDYLMKVPVPISVYEILNVLINQQMIPQVTPQEMTRTYHLNKIQLQ